MGSLLRHVCEPCEKSTGENIITEKNLTQFNFTSVNRAMGRKIKIRLQEPHTNGP